MTKYRQLSKPHLECVKVVQKARFFLIYSFIFAVLCHYEQTLFGFVLLTLKLNVQFEMATPKDIESNCSMFDDFLFKLYMLLLLAVMNLKLGLLLKSPCFAGVC